LDGSGELGGLREGSGRWEQAAMVLFTTGRGGHVGV